jgi:hypothetical protein
MESHYTFMSSKLPQQGNIDYSESFIVMKSKKSGHFSRQALNCRGL